MQVKPLLQPALHFGVAQHDARRALEVVHVDAPAFALEGSQLGQQHAHEPHHARVVTLRIVLDDELIDGLDLLAQRRQIGDITELARRVHFGEEGAARHVECGADVLRTRCCGLCCLRRGQCQGQRRGQPGTGLPALRTRAGLQSFGQGRDAGVQGGKEQERCWIGQPGAARVEAGRTLTASCSVPASSAQRTSASSETARSSQCCTVLRRCTATSPA